MYRYTYHPNAEAPAYSAGTERTLYDDVQRMCGRNPLEQFASVRRRLREGGVVYIAPASKLHRGVVIRQHRVEPGECGFCHGEPVADAASWQDGKPRPAAPCPRCGSITS